VDKQVTNKKTKSQVKQEYILRMRVLIHTESIIAPEVPLIEKISLILAA
jgi:hypothetical protein